MLESDMSLWVDGTTYASNEPTLHDLAVAAALQHLINHATDVQLMDALAAGEEASQDHNGEHHEQDRG